VTGMRRLDLTNQHDFFARAQSSPVRAWEIQRDAFERLQRERPELFVALDSGLMLLAPRGTHARLHFAFDGIESFRHEFGPALLRLLDAAKSDEVAAGVFLRFTDLPNRPYVEPVLTASLFEMHYEWMEMNLTDLSTAVASGEIAPGFRLRPARADEYDAFAIVDRSAFPQDPFSPADYAEALERAGRVLFLEERKSRRLAGYLILAFDPDGAGRVRVVGLHEDLRRRGLGESLMRWSIAWFKERGTKGVRLNVRVDNPPAFALYRKLGFAPGRRGLVYRRPTAPDEIEALKAKQSGSYIKFGGWR
jgi:ribosomal-protein-alanine N-acetyltransferase